MEIKYLVGNMPVCYLCAAYLFETIYIQPVYIHSLKGIDCTSGN